MAGRRALFASIVIALTCCVVSGTLAAYWQATDMGLAGSTAYVSLSTVTGKIDYVWTARSAGGLDLILRSSPADPWTAQSCGISRSPVYKCVADDTRDAGQTMRCFAARSTGGIDLITGSSGAWAAGSLNLAGSPVYSWISVVRGKLDTLWAARSTGGIDLVSRTGGCLDGVLAQPGRQPGLFVRIRQHHPGRTHDGLFCVEAGRRRGHDIHGQQSLAGLISSPAG